MRIKILILLSLFVCPAFSEVTSQSAVQPAVIGIREVIQETSQDSFKKRKLAIKNRNGVSAKLIQGFCQHFRVG